MVHPIAEARRAHTGRVLHASEYVTNPRGLKLFTQWWVAPPTEITGIVAVVHGFTGESSWFVQLTAVHIAKSGFAVCAIDHQGHGFSDGLIAHIPDVNRVVDDCIAILITLRRGGDNGVNKPYDGLILNVAVFGISDKFKLPWPLEHFPSIAAALIPTWQLVPTRGSILQVSFKVEWKHKLAMASPRRTVAKPRAATAQELLRICREVQKNGTKIEVPLLIVHGGDDLICDPACAEELYKRAASKDKTIKVYPGMWHQLIGEPDENVELVFGDMVEWLKLELLAAESLMLRITNNFAQLCCNEFV